MSKMSFNLEVNSHPNLYHEYKPSLRPHRPPHGLLLSRKMNRTSIRTSNPRVTQAYTFSNPFKHVSSARKSQIVIYTPEPELSYHRFSIFVDFYLYALFEHSSCTKKLHDYSANRNGPTLLGKLSGSLGFHCS